MAVMWIMILSRETIEEGDTEMAFHLASELLMASLCAGSGICLLRGKSAARGRWLSGGTHPVYAMRKAWLANLAGHCMAIYSVINAAGYYAERDEGSMLLVFLALLLLSVSVLAIHFSKSPPEGAATKPY